MSWQSKYGTEKVGLMRRVFLLLGLLSRGKKPKASITDCVKRCDDMEERVANIEQVTLSWTTSEMTEDQLRDMGIIE
jgi:hypothetical protein